jgi:DtxR family Mn-dependent transcriptional regulator
MSEGGSTGALSAVAQDYLKLVWTAQEWSDEPVTVSSLATRLGVGPSTVSETVRRLADAGLVGHEPYGAIELTDAGRTHALAMVRRHRLLETFLVAELGYGWDEVHDEAEVLEHAVSDRFVERVAERLGHPERDPHGDVIPGPDGTLRAAPAHTLWDAEPGRWVVARIADTDPDLLRHLREAGVLPDATVEVRPERVTGVVAVRALPDGPRVDLGQPAASSIWLVAAPA